MTCVKCQHEGTKKCGYSGRKRIQRYRCPTCKATFLGPVAERPLGSHYVTRNVDLDQYRVIRGLGQQLEKIAQRGM